MQILDKIVYDNDSQDCSEKPKLQEQLSIGREINNLIFVYVLHAMHINYY